MSQWRGDLHTCPRCGIRRRHKPTRPGVLCRDCRDTDPRWGEKGAAA